MSGGDWLVLVAGDGGTGTGAASDESEADGSGPGGFRAFLARGDQGVNIARNTWHGVLCPLAPAGSAIPRLFAVVDRIGPAGEAPGANLEEYALDPPLAVASRPGG
jgi:ureidoglycolate lyase